MSIDSKRGTSEPSPSFRQHLARFLRRPGPAFEELRTDPILAPPLLIHALGGLVLGLAAAVRGAPGLSEAMRDAAADANTTVAAISVGVIMVMVTPIVTVMGALGAGAVGHAAGRLLGSQVGLRTSVSFVAIALLPVAVRNAALALGVAVGGEQVTDRLDAVRYGDPFVLISLVVAIYGARWTLRLGWPQATVVAVVVCLAPAALQIAFL